MISDKLKRIYNIHLAISRKSQGKPFKLRSNFDKLDNEIIVILEKLSNFFKSYPVDIDSYFLAPYKMYDDVEYYPLNFYISQKAKKIYALYMKSLELDDPDSKDSLIRLQNALIFVYDFCKERGLTFEEYLAYSEDSLPVFVKHLKEHKINFYTLHSLGVSKINIDQRILDFIFGDFYITFQKTKNKFYASKKMKAFSNLAKDKLNNKLKTNQTNNKI